MTPHTPPAFKVSAFHCPMCGAFANQVWHRTGTFRGTQVSSIEVPKIMLAHCQHCKDHSIWIEGKMVYPNSGSAPLPNSDMPADVRQDYEEARSIVTFSPRGAVALLRLAIQRLCKHLGEKGKNVDDDIAALVEKGLPKKLQQALDNVRVVGNNAVHPGQIDLTDDVETANKLFAFVNIICDNQITQPKAIDEFYNSKLPDGARAAIEKRDGK